ncbi:major facilitator superfamily MFS_1 [Sphingopyxis sp. FD7]|nr:major facilitator superfamily MFS_1 [Sphingopyxis sp. FD7]
MSIDSPFISTSIAEKVAMPAQAIRKGMTGEGESGRMVGAVAEFGALIAPPIRCATQSGVNGGFGVDSCLSLIRHPGAGRDLAGAANR